MYFCRGLQKGKGNIHRLQLNLETPLYALRLCERIIFPFYISELYLIIREKIPEPPSPAVASFIDNYDPHEPSASVLMKEVSFPYLTLDLGSADKSSLHVRDLNSRAITMSMFE